MNLHRQYAWGVLVIAGLGASACGDSGEPLGGGGQGGEAGGAGAPADGGAGGAGGDLGCEALVCDTGAFCFDGACHPCEAPLGELHDRVLALGDDEEDRAYFLYVPAGYSCETPAPLLVDFHGTASGSLPEEAYQLDALLALAEAEGALVVRPRSRSSLEGGFEVYRWDQNNGDLERNVRFTEKLVAELSATYHIDPARTYASGFSSGSNMTAQFLDASHRGLFRGLAPIAGGVWSAVDIAPFDGDAPRVYAATGYRDYLYPSFSVLAEALVSAGVASDRVFYRETDTGHDLFAWHFPELFAWLDRGERPPLGTLDAAFQIEDPQTPASLLHLVGGGGGPLLATAADGSVVRRAPDGSWAAPEVVAPGRALVGACVTPSGLAFVTGEKLLSASAGGAAWSAPATLPELGTQVFGATYANALACDDATLTAAGYWSAVASADGGASFEDVSLEVSGYEAQVAALAIGDSGTQIAVGYYAYVGRRAAGDSDFTPRSAPLVSEWWNDVAALPGGGFVVVGEGGATLRSVDDGQSWTYVAAPTSEPLYAVAFGDAATGVAVGKAGSVVVTHDGGQSWTALSTGTDRFLGGVAFIDATTVVIVGEAGTALRLVLP